MPRIRETSPILYRKLGTYSGKIEFASEDLKVLSPDDDERPPVPHYIPSWEGHETELYKR